MTEVSQSKPSQFFQNLLLAGTIAAFSKTLVAPFETWRIYSYPNEDGKNILRQMLKEQGISALWTRNLRKIRVSSPHQALNFSFYDFFKTSFCSSSDPKMEFWRFLLSHMTVGAAAGCMTLLILYPLNLPKLSKIQLAADYNKSNGFTKDGIKNLYKGFRTLAVGVMIYRSVYFGGYETAKKVIFPEWEEKSFIGKYFTALGVTSLGVLLSNPVDVVRKRMEMKSLDGETMKYKGALDCAKKMYYGGGWRVFMRGSWSSLISGISAALNLVLYDELQSRLFGNKNARI